jgi:hypothetical protein
MKCQEFTQKEFYKKANEIIKKAFQENDINSLELLSNTTRTLFDMNFIKMTIAFTITYNCFNVIEIIKQKEKKYDKQ